jgi:DNA-binding CsgD family transcriptional regulator
LLLAVLIAGLLWMIYRKNTKIAAIGAEKSRLEIQGLENEIALNGRLVEYSKLIIDKEKDFLQRLEEIRKGLPGEHQATVKSLIRELDGAARINHQENPFVAESLLQQQDQLNEKYPGFEQLNATEKRILVLTEHLYTSKDIAQMLGCSPQYVRNVRSRIRKKISE